MRTIACINKTKRKTQTKRRRRRKWKKNWKKRQQINKKVRRPRIVAESHKIESFDEVNVLSALSHTYRTPHDKYEQPLKRNLKKMEHKQTTISLVCVVWYLLLAAQHDTPHSDKQVPSTVPFAFGQHKHRSKSTHHLQVNIRTVCKRTNEWVSVLDLLFSRLHFTLPSLTRYARIDCLRRKSRPFCDSNPIGFLVRANTSRRAQIDIGRLAEWIFFFSFHWFVVSILFVCFHCILHSKQTCWPSNFVIMQFVWTKQFF